MAPQSQPWREASSKHAENANLSLLYGSTEPVLLHITLSELLQQQAGANSSSPCVIFPEYDYRTTYKQLYEKTLAVAKGLIALGIRHGDHIGIFAGNCPPYVELFFAASHVGASLVVLNITYTPSELRSALKHSACKIFFTSPTIGKLSNTAALDMLDNERSDSRLPDLKTTILLKPASEWSFPSYSNMLEMGKGIAGVVLDARMRAVDGHDICNLQFTSGTTGNPKASMLSHSNLINNARFTGDRMAIGPHDVLCCPPPLFHCFGLVLGLLAVLTHGSCIVFPSESFSPKLVLEAVIKEKCTALHGVPAMFAAELELIQADMDFSNLRTGIAAGVPVPPKMMVDLREKLNLLEMTNTYGMTETSPASFMTRNDDPVEKRISTVGKILPHMKAKIINAAGDIPPIGSRGELCVAGFALQKGYWRNPEKTAEVMRRDESGVLWMHTGDEAVFDTEGYCSITGRIKDIIIRGGENILPFEIEERLAQHISIVQASVVGIPDDKYGDTVAAFLQQRLSQSRPSNEELREFVCQTLGRHKAPVHVFWLEHGEDFPKTGSGKIKKHVLRARGAETLKGALPRRSRL